MSGRVTFEEVVALRERLAAAEQRGADAEARAERLAAALQPLAALQGEWFDGMAPSRRLYVSGRGDKDAAITVGDVKRAHTLLTAPATQPDERAAAERGVVEAARAFCIVNREWRARFFYGDSSHAARGDAVSSAEAAIFAAVAALDATDGAAKETT